MEMIKTPHINAYPGDFAKTVLMPGCPHRSKFIAETFLDEARLINDIRGIQGYTGYYKGTPVSVMASGMGMPSIGIYSYELYNLFGVENIIRIGSAGALQESTNLGDIIIAMSASTDSNYLTSFAPQNSTFAPCADFSLLKRATDKADEMNMPYVVGNILSSDIFYSKMDVHSAWQRLGILAVDMETAALYTNAAYYGGRALSILTVSDQIFKGEGLDAEARRSKLINMIELALNTAIEL